MNVQEDDTPGGLTPREAERDVLAERRARRGDLPADPILVRRAETAEAAAQVLEERLAGAAQELEAVTGRLAGREDELRVVSERLGHREGELRAVSERLTERERELRRAELEIKGRIDGLERRVGDVQGELAEERDARERAERELRQVREALVTTEALVGDLKEIAKRLRTAMQAAPEEVVPQVDEESERARRAQMAEALASAVERLRARVAAVGELHDQRLRSGEPEDGEAFACVEPGAATQAPPAQPSELLAYVPRSASQPAQRPDWLAPAIRRVAERRDARLAGELVLELLPAQARTFGGRLRYEARIAELGRYEMTIAGGVGTVARSGPQAYPDFVLEGPAAAFAELAAGGVAGVSRGRRPKGLRVRSGRLRARRLLSARRRPVALSDLADAGMSVWPGLLLLAFAEAIDPAWSASQDLELAFAIEGPQPATLRLHVRDGQPPLLTRALPGREGAAAEPEAAAAEPDMTAAEADATVHLSERAFLCMLAGRALPEGERVLLQGDPSALDRLLTWTDRVQGIQRTA